MHLRDNISIAIVLIPPNITRHMKTMLKLVCMPIIYPKLYGIMKHHNLQTIAEATNNLVTLFLTMQT